MAGQEEEGAWPITVIHRGHSFPILVRSTMTLSDLRKVVEIESGVNAKRQTLIFRGHRLKGDDGKVGDIAGLKRGGKIMMMVNWGQVVGEEKGKGKVSKVVKKEIVGTEGVVIRKVEEIGGKLKRLEEKIVEVEGKFRNVEKGFLEEEKAVVVAGRLERGVKEVEEGVMRVLEELDGITGDGVVGDGKVWRAQRKVRVKQGQGLLGKCDGLMERIGVIKKDEFGEIESRRGKEEKKASSWWWRK